MARWSRTQTINLFLFSQYLNWHEILAKKTRIYGIAMQRGGAARESQNAKRKTQKSKVKDHTSKTFCELGNRVGR
jgi:hypothetical protein